MQRIQPISLFALIAITVICYLPGVYSFFIGESWRRLEHIQTHNDNLIHVCFSNYLSTGATIALRPVKYFFYYLFYNAFGLNPLPFHLMSLFLHVSCVLLVFYIISRFTEDRLVGLMVAALFSVYWLNSEAVAWFEGDQEVLRTFFALIAVIAFYSYRKGQRLLHYLLALFAFILSIGSQENSVTLSFVLVCLDIYYRNINVNISELLKRPIDGTKRLKIREFYPHIPFISLSAGYILWLKFYSPAVASVSDRFTLLNVLKGIEQHVLYLFTLPIFIDSIFLFRIGVVTVLLFTFIYLACCPREEKARVNLLFLSLLILIVPFSLRGGFAARYAYLPSIITLTVSILLLREGARRLFNFGFKNKALETAAYGTCFIFCFILLPFNYSFLQKNLNYYKDLGKLSHSFIETLKKDFPEGIQGREVAFVNFPRMIEPGFGSRFGLTNALVFEDIPTILNVVFRGDDLSNVSVINIPLPFQTGFHPIDAQTLDASQYDILVQKPNKKIYLFNSFTKEILDVSEISYNKLHTLVRKSST